MQSRILIYDRSGQRLEELTGTCWREWVLNAAGMARIGIPKTDPKLTERVVRFGNFVVIQHDRAGVWAGVIDTPRRWTENEVEITAYGIEHLLHYRVAMLSLRDGSLGDHFRQIIDLANQKEEVRIRLGSVYAGKHQTRATLYFDSLYDALFDLGSNGGDWSFEPAFDAGGVLYFVANWHESRGVRRNFLLEEGHNLEQVEGDGLLEQGTIANEVITFNSGRPDELAGSASDQASASKYGLRQISFNAQRASKLSPDVLLARQKEPRRTYPYLVALDVNNTFDYLGVGDVLRLRLNRYGFKDNGFGTDTYVRIRAKSLDDQDNKMVLVADEVAA